MQQGGTIAASLATGAVRVRKFKRELTRAAAGPTPMELGIRGSVVRSCILLESGLQLRRIVHSMRAVAEVHGGAWHYVTNTHVPAPCTSRRRSTIPGSLARL